MALSSATSSKALIIGATKISNHEDAQSFSVKIRIIEWVALTSVTSFKSLNIGATLISNPSDSKNGLNVKKSERSHRAN